MSILSRLHTPRLRAGGTGLDPFNPLYFMPQGWWGIPSTAGIRVYPELAMTLSALWCGTTFIAKNVGCFPFHVYEDLENGGKRRAKEHPLYPVLHHDPNQWQTAMEFYEMMVGHLVLRGNFYAEIIPGKRGFVDQLIPRHPDRMQVKRLPNGRLQYVLTGLGATERTLTQDEVYHVRGFSTDGIVGMSVVAFGANSMGAALAAETYAARFFKHGASAALAVKTPNQLDEEGMKNVRQSISAYLTGLDNVGGVLVLEEGMGIDKIGLTPEDAQLLTTREHTVREVARWLALPSYLLSDGGKPATYASAYQFAQDLVSYTFRPMVGRIEQRARKDLLLKPDQFFVEADMRALLRGDLQARAQFYHLSILDGWMSRNEARLEEGLNPEDGLSDFLEPVNMQDATGAGPLQPIQGAPTIDPVDPNQDARHLVATARRHDVQAVMLTIESAQRVVRKEIAAAQKAAVRFANDGAGWSTWCRTFYDEHATFVSTTLKLPLAVAREYAAQQGALLEQEGIRCVEDWENTRPGTLASWALNGVDRPHS